MSAVCTHTKNVNYLEGPVDLLQAVTGVTYIQKERKCKEVPVLWDALLLELREVGV